MLILGVGSNIAPEVHVPAAIVRLLVMPDVRIVATSTFYRSIPVGSRVGPAPFVNGALALRTDRPAHRVKAELCRPIERALGRDEVDRAGPRPIDLDVIAFGDIVHDDPGLVIPDPDWLVRPFVATPVAEVAPDLVHPVDGRTAAAIAEAVGRAGLVIDAPLTGRVAPLACGRSPSAPD